MDEPIFKSGVVTILGAPNVGKSTLLNAMLGEKLAIMSDKPQTTRTRILGVLHRTNAQIMFLDTPGVHNSAKALNKRMIDTALDTTNEADAILYVINADHRDKDSNEVLFTHVQKTTLPVILAINKVDKIDKQRLLPIISEWADKYNFQAIVPISALLKIQLDELTKELILAMPEGPRYFPEDEATDLPVRFFASELIREKVFCLTQKDIPYSVAVTIDSFKQKTDTDIVEINATIHVERDSQKGILIGKGGLMLKQIGSLARKDIEHLIDAKVMLRLWVKVTKDWSRNPKLLSEFGY